MKKKLWHLCRASSRRSEASSNQELHITDLIKFCGEDGEYHLGVLSVSMMESSNERLVTLHDIIGDEPEEKGDFIDTTSYDFTIEKLEEELQKDGYSEEDISRSHY